jgi:negative regulator of sigma E activity
MANNRDCPQAPSALSLRIGRWEARATGWGVAALVVLAVLFAAVVLRP